MQSQVVIDSLSQNPFPSGYKKLFEEESYRIRIGNYRIVYSVDTNSKIVVIERAKHRRDVYRKF